MGIFSNFTSKRQMIGIVDAIADGIEAPVVSYDSYDNVDGIDKDSVISIAKIDTSGLDDSSECVYIVFIKVGKENAATVKILMQGGIWAELSGNVYILDETGIRELFNDVSKRFKILKAPEDGGEIVENMMSYDILLKDFYLAKNRDNDEQFDICEVQSEDSKESTKADVVAHNVTAISRFSSNNYVVFDIACNEYMVLIIVDKKTAEVKEIRTIGKSEKDKLNEFKDFVAKDAGSFFEYMKTQRLIF